MSIHAAERKRVAISGASGFIGTRLCRYLEGKGHRVYRLVRHPAQRENEIPWSPQEGIPLLERLEPLDAVLHLAGKNIADGRWTSTRKAEILQSRVEGTLALSRTLLALPHPPQVLLSASAIGFYGDRQDTPVDEDSPPGSGFLAEVCRQWEAAAQPARDAGIRVVHPRIGVVLSTEGGALAKMLLPFRWGLGGPTGPGTQFMSWIALADLLRAFHFCMQTESIQGPVNFTAPHPVTNRAFAQTLAGQLQRPAGLPLPAFAVSLLFGEMGRELLLSGAKVLPKKLLDAGFSFQHDQLENALWAELKE